MSAMIDAYRTSARIEGACLCGSVKICVDGDHVAAVGLCHCDMCQRWNGGIFGVFTASANAVTVEGPIKSYRSSSFSERAFCKTCGSHLWMRNTGPEDDYEFMPGLFPAARKFTLISEIYHDLAPAYGQLRGDHKCATRADYEARNPHVEGDTP